VTNNLLPNKLRGASVWESELYEHLMSHESSERELLVEYKRTASDSQSRAFQYLADLIIDDEVRHHRIFRELASALKTDAEFRPEQPAVPRLDHWGPDAASVVEDTTRLLDREHADADELRRLSRQFKDLKDETMWQLLVKLMEMDTAKHIAILEFIRGHARKSR
jgi:glycine cleavage system regulatory protein